MSEEKKELIDDRKPWDRIPGETVLEFTRFEKYRLLGPNRSIRGAFRVENPESKSIPKSAWFRAADQNRWKERAEAWDLAEIEADRIRFNAEKKKSKESRIKVLEGYLGRVVKAAAQLDPVQARWQDVTEAITSVLKGLREEYGESSKITAEVTGANGANVQFVAFMPAPIEDPDEWAKKAKELTGQ